MSAQELHFIPVENAIRDNGSTTRSMVRVKCASRTVHRIWEIGTKTKDLAMVCIPSMFI